MHDAHTHTHMHTHTHCVRRYGDDRPLSKNGNVNESHPDYEQDASLFLFANLSLDPDQSTIEFRRPREEADEGVDNDCEETSAAKIGSGAASPTPAKGDI